MILMQVYLKAVCWALFYSFCVLWIILSHKSEMLLYVLSPCRYFRGYTSSSIFKTVAFLNLQTYLNSISEWILHWRIKSDEAKSVRVTFSTEHPSCAGLKLNDVNIPQAEHLKYLGIHLDMRLSCRAHIKTQSS